MTIFNSVSPSDLRLPAFSGNADARGCMAIDTQPLENRGRIAFYGTKLYPGGADLSDAERR
jgi:hypothetical protein